MKRSIILVLYIIILFVPIGSQIDVNCGIDYPSMVTKSEKVELHLKKDCRIKVSWNGLEKSRKFYAGTFDQEWKVFNFVYIPIVS